MTTARRILVTGSTGFVGQRLCAVLAERGYAVVAAVRQFSGHVADQSRDTRLDRLVVGEINEATDWTRALADMAAIIHLAGRAHVMHERPADSLPAYRRVNVAGTLRLAETAAAAGVRRFVFVSSIKVNGESTSGTSFTAGDVAAPLDPYGISKWEAEQGLRRIEQDTGMEVVVVRPPLVYGPGVKGNFLNLLRWIQRGLPLPVGACRNQRSLVGLDNLVDLLTCCVSEASAAGQTFLASDGQDLSTPDLVRRIAHALGTRPRLVPMPPSWLKAATRLMGKPGIYDRLCGSLRVDVGHARAVLGWIPSVPIDEELARTAQWFLQGSATL